MIAKSKYGICEENCMEICEPKKGLEYNACVSECVKTCIASSDH